MIGLLALKSRPFGSLWALPFVLLLPLVACTQKGSAPKEEDTVYDTAEEMPRFPGCEQLELPSDQDRYFCSLQKLMDYLGNGLEYPAEARAKGTSGEAVVQFIVHEDGQVSFVEVVNDPGDGLGEAAARQVRRMIDEDIRWRPGYKDGKAVAVRFNLPVAFNLPRDPNTGRIPGQ
jgi:TonB family protein